VPCARLDAWLGETTDKAVEPHFSLQRLAEVAFYRGRRGEARALLDDALDVARQTPNTVPHLAFSLAMTALANSTANANT
jgi:hypothetical protein